MDIRPYIDNQIARMNSEEFLQARMKEDPTMVSYLDVLMDINRCGFLTTNSQSGQIVASNTIRMIERAYVCGVMRASDAEAFVKTLSVSSDKVAGQVVVSDADSIPIPVTLSAWVTHTKIDTHTNVRFSMYPDEASHDFETLGIPESFQKHFVFVLCYDTVWGRDARIGLFRDVAEALRKRDDVFMTRVEMVQAQLDVVHFLLQKDSTNKELVLQQQRLTNQL
jgi:hypothetical protein